MTAPVFDEAFWNDLYGDAPIWSGAPNPFLVETASGLAAGSVLDVGSGEGGDAIWLAAAGWRVTGVDLSTVALKRAQDATADDPITASRITWHHVDLLTWTPPPAAFDLVSSQYMQLPSRDMRALVVRLAAAVRSGGTLLVVGHADVEHRAGARGAGTGAAGSHGVGADAAGSHGAGAAGSHGTSGGAGARGSADAGSAAAGSAAAGATPADAAAAGSHGASHGHDTDDRPIFDADLFFTAESLATLLPPTDWHILSAGSRPHPTRPGTDAVLRARRL